VRALPFREASIMAAAMVRDAADADVGAIGNTTFGDGLPRGAVTRHRFRAFLRFDNPLVRATVDGATLRAVLARSNHFEEMPFADRTGEYLVATPLAPIVPGRRYTIATDGWIRANAERYLGTSALQFEEVSGPSLRDVVARGLARGPERRAGEVGWPGAGTPRG
jgi:2',3'-cyclic-nucleotide 2'-phosphodiesterase (5'-nucleotidase family)